MEAKSLDSGNLASACRTMALFEAMDYKGQQLCEYLYSFIIILFGIIAWFVGYSQGDFFLSFKGWAAGLAIALVVSNSPCCLCPVD